MKSKSRSEEAPRRRLTPLDGLAGNVEEQKHAATMAFEEKVVAFLFSHFHLPAQVKYQMEESYRQDFGVSRLVLARFAVHYPTFPVFLAVKKYRHWKHVLTISRAMNAFGREPLLKDWAEVEEDIPEEFQGLSKGIVHDWPNVSQGMVLHDMPFDQYRLHPGRAKRPRRKDEPVLPRTRLFYETAQGELLTWEPLVNLCLRIDQHEGENGKGWRPEYGGAEEVV